MITYEQVKSLVAPGGKKAIIDATVEMFNTYAEQYHLNTPLRKAHFLAQIAHESDHFNTTKEYGGHKARYAPWFGRGLIQVTWEENYKQFYEWAVAKGLNPPNFMSKEGREAVATFPWAFLGAVWYWEAHKLNRFADADDVRGLTKAINGGYNGLDDRIRYLTKAKKIFAVADETPAPVEASAPTYTASQIQQALIKRGYRLTETGKMDAQTAMAIRTFQKLNRLVADGVVGPKTARVLFK